MFQWIKKVLIGRPLKNEAIHGEKYKVLWGLPILASDSISSVGYAGEEILIALVPVIGALSFMYLTYISLAIIALLVILTFSYSQTISAYTGGGGAYIVASDNLGHVAGVTAGTSLAIDYILTVAVSISSGIAQLTSAFHSLAPYHVLICIAVLLFIMIGNLRGIKESSRMFSIPTYLFIIGSLAMIIIGIVKIRLGVAHPVEPIVQMKANGAVSIFLILKAFSNGCTALTGVEAVSNAVPNFDKPAAKHAKKTLWLLSLFVLLIFGGISILANLYHIVPVEGKTVLNQIAFNVFGNNLMFYFYTATSILILVMAANTAYSDFPLLMSIMGKDGYVPRQFSMRGDRLSFSNGIIVLSAIAAILIIVFRGDVALLLPLYAIGAFSSFTLSQFGMVMRWRRIKGKWWRLKAFINGFGTLTTAVVVLIIAFEKFKAGAWIVIIITPVLLMMFMRIKKHYVALAKQLDIKESDLKGFSIEKSCYKNLVIVPLESINQSSLRALRFAKTISDKVIAFNISIDEEQANKIKGKYSMINTDIPLIVKYSPYRKVVSPLLKFIESTEYDYEKGDMITVILPQFTVKSWWQKMMHNNTSFFIRKELLKHKHIVVATMPLQLKNDKSVLKNTRSN
ncbi:amino acid transporter-like protein [Ruminiclostridium papyrosolvens DSM 2782]|uniref:Amino acid transporter-like protein n=1 Tax=Ruminiclostridium papyrosolvens DSM 2782 TaxID=588581 RepID=F1TB65_9FIRM|nr:APC family permease [Ruminiclostridium papyrosolvens]EGD48269.1 amino acid transporter-like protein [Ruminiclostridium papyrosolvens DSM 2782]WES34224.1 APC family permease [Ruminiclostridium papyrosolvens DSM 2782]